MQRLQSLHTRQSIIFAMQVLADRAANGPPTNVLSKTQIYAAYRLLHERNDGSTANAGIITASK